MTAPVHVRPAPMQQTKGLTLLDVAICDINPAAEGRHE